MKSVKQLNVYRWCLDCGYERFEKEDVHIDDKGREVSEGFITCPECKGGQLALGGYRDRRRSVDWLGMDDEVEKVKQSVMDDCRNAGIEFFLEDEKIVVPAKKDGVLNEKAHHMAFGFLRRYASNSVKLGCVIEFGRECLVFSVHKWYGRDILELKERCKSLKGLEDWIDDCYEMYKMVEGRGSGTYGITRAWRWILEARFGNVVLGEELIRGLENELGLPTSELQKQRVREVGEILNVYRKTLQEGKAISEEFPIAAFGKIFNHGEHLGRSIVRAIRNAMANNGLEVKGVEDESK